MPKVTKPSLAASLIALFRSRSSIDADRNAHEAALDAARAWAEKERSLDLAARTPEDFGVAYSKVYLAARVAVSGDSEGSTGASNESARALAKKMANFSAILFEKADSYIEFPVSARHVAALGSSPKAGLLAAAIDLRNLLSLSVEGREALRDLGFEKFFEQFEGK